ncbi:hypothetical protein LTS15_008410 [Exophiala xenobiotica]|nr:hypothetical protein LTS15_008410 [Exophiala xenobiotica]
MTIPAFGPASDPAARAQNIRAVAERLGMSPTASGGAWGMEHVADSTNFGTESQPTEWQTNIGEFHRLQPWDIGITSTFDQALTEPVANTGAQFQDDYHPNAEDPDLSRLSPGQPESTLRRQASTSTPASDTLVTILPRTNHDPANLPSLRLPVASTADPEFTSTASSWIIPTPPTQSQKSNSSPSSFVSVGNQLRPIAPKEREEPIQRVPEPGLCSNVQKVPPCEPDPSDPTGECLPCKGRKGNVLCKSIPCLRMIITKASLYREQDRPYQLFSTRWQNMDIVDITTWRSREVKTIQISQIFLDAPYSVEVREFEPVDGDMLEEKWMSGSEVKIHSIPRYALANMGKTAEMLVQYINNNVARYINGVFLKNTGHSLLWHTLFCLQIPNNPHHLYGHDKIGGEVVYDSNSPFYGVVPMPAIMIAQMECIMYTRVLRPLTRKVTRQLNELVLANKRKYWLTIYLTMFILFHSGAMLTKRDWETARQYNMKENFANPDSIRQIQMGVINMLVHFHSLNKGVAPFNLVHDEKGLSDLAKAAHLQGDSLTFVKRTSKMVNEPRTVALMREVQAKRDYGHDLYWVSQLYDQEWKPGEIA